VLFEGELDGAEAYVLIQRQFELPDGGLCYVESHDKDYIGHFKVTHAELGRNRLFLKLARRTAAELEVVFNTTDQNWRQVARIMRIMIPRLRVRTVRSESVAVRSIATRTPPLTSTACSTLVTFSMPRGS
jgi:hypothetical protein